MIDFNHGLDESISIHEVFTLNLKKTYQHRVVVLNFSKLTFLFIKRLGFLHDFPFIIIFWWFFKVWVDGSWKALWPYRLFDRSRPWFVWINWCSWGVCPPSISKTYMGKGMGIGFSVTRKEWYKWKACKYEHNFTIWVLDT